MKSGLDEKKGIIHLHEVIPNEGDSLLVVNTGERFEFRQQSWLRPPFDLTADEIVRLKAGTIVFN